MIILFISAILYVFTSYLSILCFCYQGINRAVINTPIELMYSSIKIEDGSYSFDSGKFESTIMTYYESSLSRYTSSREIEFYYYNFEDGSMCLTNYCSAVEISIDCKLIFGTDYHRVMFYEIRGGKNG